MHLYLDCEPFVRLQPTLIEKGSIPGQSISPVRRDHCQEHVSSAWMHLSRAGRDQRLHSILLCTRNSCLSSRAMSA